MRGVSGPGPTRNVSSPAARERDQPVMNALSNSACDQQHRADAARDQFAHRRTVDLSSETLTLRLRPVRGHGHRPIEQRGPVVRQHLGGNIHQQGMLAQPTDTLQHLAGACAYFGECDRYP